MSETVDSRRWRPSALPGALTAGLAVLIVALAWRGGEYYDLPLEARVDHSDYRVLAPSGVIGQGYGIAGTALFVLNLFYLVRRRLAKLPLGSMRTWLDVHVFTGLAGAVLVLFHSAFQVRTEIAVLTAVSLLVVVVTGLVGRWLHALVPSEGDRLLDEQLRGLDAIVPGLAERVRAALDRLPATRLGHATLFQALGTLPRWIWQWWVRRRAAREVIRDAISSRCFDAAEYAFFLQVEARTISVAGRAAMAAAASSLLRTWRGLHRLLAILMLLTVPVHIGVAWLYGYRWIWSE